MKCAFWSRKQGGSYEFNEVSSSPALVSAVRAAWPSAFLQQGRERNPAAFDRGQAFPMHMPVSEKL